jgi:hypothetical protein
MHACMYAERNDLNIMDSFTWPGLDFMNLDKIFQQKLQTQIFTNLRFWPQKFMDKALEFMTKCLTNVYTKFLLTTLYMILNIINNLWRNYLFKRRYPKSNLTCVKCACKLQHICDWNWFITSTPQRLKKPEWMSKTFSTCECYWGSNWRCFSIDIHSFIYVCQLYMT